jgi:hypothetical protein
MNPPAHPHDPSVRAYATAVTDPAAIHIGTPNAAELFYAACSRNYAEDACGCPICRQAAQDRAARSRDYDDE